MITAEINDKVLVIDIISKAFKDNQSVKYIVGQGESNTQRIRALINYSFEVLRLLDEILTDAKQKGLPVYLETSTKKNLLWYHHFGFKIYDKLVLSYTLHFLKHEALNER